MLYTVSFISQASKVKRVDVDIDVPFDEFEKRVREVVLAAEHIEPEIEQSEWDVLSIEHNGIMLDW